MTDGETPPVLSSSAKRKQRARRAKERDAPMAGEEPDGKVATATPVEQQRERRQVTGGYAGADAEVADWDEPVLNGIGAGSTSKSAKKKKKKKQASGDADDADVKTGQNSPSSQKSNSQTVMLNRLSSIELIRPVTIIEPESAHTASIILLHGLGDKSTYWCPFYQAMQAVGVKLSEVRWIALDAPKRTVYGERCNAWFEYHTDRSGADVEDDINEDHLKAFRSELQGLITEELQRMRAARTSAPKVLLAGSSQGGSVALDAGLTIRSGGEDSVAGVVMLRSLALGATARALADLPKPSAALPVLAVSGSDDDTFSLKLVRKQLALVCGGRSAAATVEHVVVEDLDHDTDYSVKEIAAFIRFVVDVLGLEVAGGKRNGFSEAGITAVLPDEPDDPSNKAWCNLTESEQQLAKQLGIRSATAWDDGTAPVWEVPWNKLSTLQRMAAKSLGFRERTWDEEDKDDIAAEKSWSAMSDVERKLAHQLGVTGANAWDNGTAPIWSKAWRKLTPAQKKAAEALGFEEATWGKD